MARSTNSNKYILQLIADILSFRPNDSKLSVQLQSTKIDWELLVKIASSHLVLTTIYLRLNQKKLLTLLPNDLKLYLEELTAINRNRNLTLLNEIKDVSAVLNNNKINHVFLKGSALLSGSYFQDIGERMIGDIDILIDTDQIENAFQLLTIHGYSKSINFNYENTSHRHLARQVSENKMAAIELHKNVLNEKHAHLIDSNSILLNKNIANGIAIPNRDYLTQSIILAFQINSKGSFYNSIHLKYIYDFLVLDIASSNPLLRKLTQDRFAAKFLVLANIYFPEIHVLNNSFSTKTGKFFYLFTLKHQQLGKILYKCKFLYENISKRIYLIIFNKSYRKHILSNKIIKRS